MYKFALTGNGPVTNHGCEAIVLGTKKIIEQEFGQSNFLLASFAKDQGNELPNNIFPIELKYQRPRWSDAWWQYQISKRLHWQGYKTTYLKPLKAKLEGVHAAFSIGGDGYTIDYGHFIVDNLIVMDNYIKSLGIPVIIWGASIGPFDREPEFERRMVQHLTNIDLVVVREPASFNYLHCLGITDNVRLAPDPAFVLDPIPCHLPEEVEHILENSCIGVNLSPLMAKYATSGNISHWINLAAKILEQLLGDLDLPLLLIPHVTSIEQDPNMDDELFLRNVLAAMLPTKRDRVALVSRELNGGNLKWIISRTKVFIGARTHSTIAALSSCVPSLSIAYSRKAWGINELVFGNREWVFSSTNLTPSSLSAHVQRLLKEQDVLRQYLGKVIPDMIENAYRVAPDVHAVIKNSK